MTPDAWARLHAAAMPPDRPWSAGEFAALLASPGVLALGDERAALLGRVAGGEAEVLTLATHPAHRRQGLARGLLDGFLAAAGAERVVLEVAEDNGPARALYAAAGFREVGRRPRYYARAGGAADALVLALAPPCGARETS